MKKPSYFSRSFVNATGVFVYIALISFLMFNTKTIFNGQDNFLAPLFMLLLFVVSAAITGMLVLGKPILLYLDGLKKEAFFLFFATLWWLVIFLVAVVILLLLW